MKKTLFSGLAVLAIAAVAGWNMNFNSQTKGMSDVALANVEALADGESTQNIPGYWLKCFNTGVGTETCTISGKITVLGITIEGNYQKGNSYSYSWEAYQCSEVIPHNPEIICDISDQGIKVNI